jgi:hypothetical protein
MLVVPQNTFKLFTKKQHIPWTYFVKVLSDKSFQGIFADCYILWNPEVVNPWKSGFLTWLPNGQVHIDISKSPTKELETGDAAVFSENF